MHTKGIPKAQEFLPDEGDGEIKVQFFSQFYVLEKSF